MNDLVNTLEAILQSKGFAYSLAVLLTVIITELVKKPLKRKATEKATAEKIPKEQLTFWLMFIPMGLSLVFTFIYYSWIDCGWDFSTFSYAGYFSEASAFYVASEGLYVVFENIIKKIKADVVKPALPPQKKGEDEDED